MGLSEDVVKELQARITKTLDDLRRDLQKLRTGRANISMLDGVRVNYYGTPTPLNQLASLAVPEPRLITIKPFDRNASKDIDKAIREANLGLNPVSEGDLIRVPIPALTEERRKEIAKQAKSKGEEHKVAVRNERRDANDRLKNLLKDKKITEDENKRASEKVQKETDAGVAKIDEIVKAKEKEVMEV
jgi:ribosome recycling factor